MKKLIVLLLSAMLILFGCSSSTANSELPESRYEVDPSTAMYTQNVEQQAQLTWFFEIPWLDLEWGRDITTQTMTTQTGITFEVMVGTADDLNNMLAAGTAPDLISLDSANPLNETPEQFAYSLNDLAEAYSPYFMTDLVDESVINWYAQEDGETYGYPSYVVTPESSLEHGYGASSAFYVREDLYTEIGSPDMTTPEGFHQAISDMQALEGVDDAGASTTGLCLYPGIGPDGQAAWTNTLFDFLSLPRYNADMSPYDGYSDPEYVAWLTELNEMYTEGLISPDNFTMTQEDMNAYFKQGGCSAYLSSNVSNDNTHMKYYNDAHPDAEYLVIDGPRNSNGDDPTLASAAMNGWTVTYVSKTSIDPQSAFYQLEYMLTPEGIVTSFMGQEGLTWEYDENGNPQYTDYWYEEIAKPDAYKVIGTGGVYAMTGDSYMYELGINQVWPSTEWMKPYVDPSNVYLANINPEEGTTEARNYATFVEQRNQIFTQAIVGGEGAVDKALADYEALKTTYDYDAILAIQAENVNANIEKLGDEWLADSVAQ